MKMHTSLNSNEVIDALHRAKASGNVDRLVDFEVLEEKGSRSRTRGFEIRLAWYGEKVKGDGRRWTNTGHSGSDVGGFYAASYDEWGWFIDALFDADPDMIFGHYKNRETFDSMTKHKFVS